MHISVTAMVTDSAVTVLSVATTFTVIQWIPGLTICQGDVKIISLNRDIVIPRFPI